MILKIRVPEGYKTPGALEEAARVLGGQLTKLELVEADEKFMRDADWQATIELPKEVIASVDRDGLDWGPRHMRRMNKRERMERGEE